jgi:aminoglycoside phosphotransferase (APT) family kinase protein
VVARLSAELACRAVATARDRVADQLRARLLARGRSCTAWYVKAGTEELVVRVPIPDSGRRVDFEVESRIGNILLEAGHPVADWQVIRVEDQTCAVGPLLAGRPVALGERWPEAFAAAVAALLSDLHDLAVPGFGPVELAGDLLRGTCATPFSGIVSRWRPAASWPFDGSSLRDHPLGELSARLATAVEGFRPAIIAAGLGRQGLVHSDLHADHLLRSATGTLGGVLDFGDATVAARAWDFALLRWYFGSRTSAAVARHYPGGAVEHRNGYLLALAVGAYKLAKHPDDATAERLGLLLSE